MWALYVEFIGPHTACMYSDIIMFVVADLQSYEQHRKDWSTLLE